MSERTVYAIASGKGGVGKTTTAINLGAMLADRGNEVIVVDTDLGMANLADFLDFEVESPTLHDVLAGDADPDDAIDRAPGDIDVLPSAPDIEAFARSNPKNLDGVIDDLRETYDYVLLDTGAGVSYDVLVPLALADGVLLVATPDVASVRDTAKTGELAARVETEVVGAVLAQRSSDILNADDVEETLGTDVLAVVPQDEAVPMGIDAGRPLAAFAPNAPAGQAYRDLAEVLAGETDPDPELDLGDDSVDVAFDADPPDRESDDGADVPADAEMAESIRDAVGGDDADGLLGGELASVAEEIRGEAADEAPSRSARQSRESSGSSRESSGSSPESSQPSRESSKSRDEQTGTASQSTDEPQRADSSGPGTGRSRTADAGAGTGGEPDAGARSEPETSPETAGRSEPETRPERGAGTGEPSDRGSSESDDRRDVETTDDGEARSVDDLIDEHLSDDRLAGSDDEDPLAGSSDDSPAGQDDDSPTAQGDDPLAGPDDGDSDAAGGNDRDTADRSEPEFADADRSDGDQPNRGGDPLAGGDASGGANTAFDPTADSAGREASEGVDSRDEAAPFGGEASDDRDSLGGRETVDDADSRGFESGETEPEDVKSERRSDDEDDDSSGVLGRLGSLFN